MRPSRGCDKNFSRVTVAIVLHRPPINISAKFKIQNRLAKPAQHRVLRNRHELIVFIAFKVAPVEKKEHALVLGAGQIGLLAAVALFGVDYFTSYYFATGEFMSSLHPVGLQKNGYIIVIAIAFANAVFGFYSPSILVFKSWMFKKKRTYRYYIPGKRAYNFQVFG
jgi:hypothetical protein